MVDTIAQIQAAIAANIAQNNATIYANRSGQVTAPVLNSDLAAMLASLSDLVGYVATLPTSIGSGSGTVSSGLAGELAGYVANGTTVAPLSVGAGLAITGNALTATGGGTSTIPQDVVYVANFCTASQMNGSADATAAIQAAIDYAFAHGFTKVEAPSNATFMTTGPIYLDPPGNMRASGNASPTMFSFSMWFDGCSTPGSTGSCVFRPTFNNGVAFWVGPGNGMRVSGFNIVGPSTAYAQMQPSGGIGVGIAGGGGGASQTTVDHVGVYNFYTAFETGANGVYSLADSNTFIKCQAQNCYIGFFSSQTQNFINSLYDCNLSATNGVVANVGTNVNVFGGNYSYNGVAAAFALSSVSALTATASGAGYVYSFTAVVSSPDAYLSAGLVYNAFAIVTPYFGVIPLTLTAFNASTKVATFTTLKTWSLTYFAEEANAVTSTALQTDTMAVTTVYAAEMATTFTGDNTHVDGVHIENGGPTTVFNVFSGFGGGKNTAVLRNSFWNNDVGSFSPPAETNPAYLARFYVQSVFPLFAITNSFVLEGCNVPNDMPYIIDLDTGHSAKFSNFGNGNLIVRCSDFGTFDSDSQGQSESSTGLGGCFFDQTPYASVLSSHGQVVSDQLRRTGRGATPFNGFHPSFHSTPCIWGSYASTLITEPLPALSKTPAPGYMLMWGGLAYRKMDVYLGAQTYYNMVSNHHFYTWGQDITTTACPGLSWNYKPGSFVVNCNDMSFLFPGLGVLLNNGTSNSQYIVTGVFPALGYFTVACFGSSNAPQLTGPSINTPVTGNVIHQEPYSITQF